MRDKVPVAFCFILLQILSSLRCSFHWLYTPDPCDLNATKRAVLRELNLALCLSLLRAQQGQLNSNQHPNADLWIFAWAELLILTPLLNKYLDVTRQLVYLYPKITWKIENLSVIKRLLIKLLLSSCFESWYHWQTVWGNNKLRAWLQYAKGQICGSFPLQHTLLDTHAQ